MTGTIDVSPDSLHDHAQTVRTYMSQLDEATRSASKTFDLNVFGVVCVGPAQVLQVWTRQADSYIREVVSAGHSVAQALDSMATEYREHEQACQARFGKIDTHVAPPKIGGK